MQVKLMNKTIILCVVMLLLVLSCSREVEKITVSSDPLSNLEAVNQLEIQVGDRVLRLTWTPPRNGDVEKYLIYRSDTTAANFAIFDSTEGTNYTDETVQNSIPYHYKVSAVSTDNFEGDLSHAISGIPGVFSIRINGNDKFVSSRRVTISPVYTANTTHIRLANEGESLFDAEWLNVSGSIPWELPDRDDTITVSASFKLSSGNESYRPVYDEIILDRFAEILSFTSNGEDGMFEAGDTLHFMLSSGEPGGEASVNLPEVGDVGLYDNGKSGDSTADDGVYERDYVIPPDVEFESGLITGSFTDPAGNTAPEATLPYRVTVRNAPGAVKLYVDAIRHDEIDLAWTESDISDFKSYRIYRSTDVPVTMQSFLVGKVTSRSQASITDTAVVPSTEYNYIVIVTDESGLTSESNTLNVTSAVNEQPNDVVLVYEVTGEETFRLNWTRNRDVDFESYRIFRSSSDDVDNSDDNLFRIEPTQSTTSFTGDVDTTATYYYRVFVYDQFGLPSDGSNTVTRP